VGDGPEIENLRKLVSQKGLQKNVSLVGAQDKSEIYSLLNDTKYFLSSYELSNLGNPLFEAISCGAVVATLNNGSTSKMIVDGVTGLISDENDFRRNALKLIECETKPELLTMMRVAARNHLAINFDSWDQRMEREYDVLKTFL
jgi:glycosyltransferase involved in cell wall biosynthesis